MFDAVELGDPFAVKELSTAIATGLAAGDAPVVLGLGAGDVPVV